MGRRYLISLPGETVCALARLKIISILVSIFLFLSISGTGCGGGTSGTGGSGFGISGTLRTTSNAPVPGVLVTVSQTGTQTVRLVESLGVKLVQTGLSQQASRGKSTTEAVTDADGQFNLSLDSRPDSFALLLQGDNFDQTVDVATVPTAAATATLNLFLNEESGEVVHEGESFEDDEGNEIEHREEGEPNGSEP